VGGLTLELVPGDFAICRLPAGAPEPALPAGTFASVTRTPDEVSVVCGQEHVPEGAERVDEGWRLLRIAGDQPLDLVGVLAMLTTPLARAAVPIFTIATFDTDWVLVPGARLQDALAALASASHRIV
jgi:uncharacterized protein